MSLDREPRPAAEQVTEGPAVSVILVSWILVDEFKGALDALVDQVDAPSFEVIVVLNGASAEGARIAATHPIVTRVIALEANVGFGAAGNAAAGVARGESLVFLNDDTRVDAHWLAALVGARNGEREPAVVASLLLDFDGTVQEAGSRILSHGGTMQWGRGLAWQEAQRIGLLQAREVDYGSAAALLVRRSVFESIGGFDPIFEPAYFEDVDLQLRIRELGESIWFEPRARVAHHLGKSTSRDHWFRAFASNRSGERFVAKWSHVLSGAPSDDDPVDALCAVEPFERPPVKPIDFDKDSSALVALSIAAEYQTWLVEQLEESRDGQSGPLAETGGPTRRELSEDNNRLRERVRNLEGRGPIGVLRMRAGLFLGNRGLLKQRR